MGASKTLEAIETIKRTAAQFASFAVLADACDKIAAVVAHEDELQRRVEALKVELSKVQAEVDATIAKAKQTKAELERQHSEWVAQYAIHRDDIRAKTTAEEKDSASRIAAAKDATRKVEQAHAAVVKSFAVEAERLKAKAIAEQAQVLGEMQNERAALAAQIGALKDELAALKQRVASIV